MAETNALAEGAASTSPDTTETNQKPETNEGAEQTASEGDEKPEDEGKRSRTASERIKEITKERNEVSIAFNVEAKRHRDSQREVQRLTKLLNDAGLSEDRRGRIADRLEDSKADLSAAEERIAERQEELAQTRLELFKASVSPEIVKAFCDPDLTVSNRLADAVIKSKYQEQLAAKISGDPSLARKLSKLSAPRASEDSLEEFGRLMERMETELSRSPSVRSVSQAPEPSGTRLKGGSSPAAKAITDPSVSMEEYADRRRAEMRAAEKR